MDTKVLDDILASLGPMVGTDFNTQILGLIDTALLPLTQVGSIKQSTKKITADTKWSEIVIDPPNNGTYSNTDILKGIKSYIYLEVKIMFDPPASSIVQILQQKAKEELWRIREAYESYIYEDGDVNE